MSGFYRRRKKDYFDMYFRDSKKRSIFWTNGFNNLPKEVYSQFLHFIDKNGNIIDLGCGNGLLLRFIMNHCEFDLIPFGIDFQEKSIKEAKDIIFPEFKENFMVKNIVNSGLRENIFDFVIIDPYHIKDEDRERAISFIISKIRVGGKIIIYSYYDSMVGMGLKDLNDFVGMHRFLLSNKRFLSGQIYLASIKKEG